MTTNACRGRDRIGESRRYSQRKLEFDGVAGAPEIGAGWPADGDALPSADQFVAESVRRASKETLTLLLSER